jgi:hypothetical protein
LRSIFFFLSPVQLGKRAVEKLILYIKKDISRDKGSGDIRKIATTPRKPIMEWYANLIKDAEAKHDNALTWWDDTRSVCTRARFDLDFFVQHTVAFQVLYVFVVMEIASRKVIHLHVTDHPTLEWKKQQLRNACFEQQPKFLLHDNDGKYGQFGRPRSSRQNRPRRWACVPGSAD